MNFCEVSGAMLDVVDRVFIISCIVILLMTSLPFSAIGFASILFYWTEMRRVVHKTLAAIQRRSSRGTRDTGPRLYRPQMQTWLRPRNHSPGVCVRASQIHTSTSSRVPICLVLARNRSCALYWSWGEHQHCVKPLNVPHSKGSGGDSHAYIASSILRFKRWFGHLEYPTRSLCKFVWYVVY